ncbi:hypothetical protein, partial [Mycobacterium sp. E2462]|uniref:hypothetical protein n=1 Tax=Mycobacterium sp. E2462 TaxID=1834133 RepID=UPI003515E2C1
MTIQPAPETMTWATALLPVAQGVEVCAAPTAPPKPHSAAARRRRLGVRRRGQRGGGRRRWRGVDAARGKR